MSDSDLERPRRTGDADRRRRLTTIVATTFAGAALLYVTLTVPSDSARFYAFGLAAGLVLIVGAVVSGSLRGIRPRTQDIVGGVGLGLVLFLFFVVAKFATDTVPGVADSVRRILAVTDNSDRALLLAVAVVNGLGEELFFRGAVYANFERARPVLMSTLVYVLVTVATLNVALVAAAIVMGAIFAQERRISGSVSAAVVTHISWSVLMITLLPR